MATKGSSGETIYPGPRGLHQFKFGFSWLHDYKNQQLQANTQGTAVFNSSAFSSDSYVNFLLGDASSFQQLNFLFGKHWVNNNYCFYLLDNWHILPRLTLNLGHSLSTGCRMPLSGITSLPISLQADYDRSLGNPVTAAGTLNPASLTHFKGTPFYLNGIKLAGVNGFPVGMFRTNTTPGNQELALPTISPETEKRWSEVALECSLSVFRATTYITLP